MIFSLLYFRIELPSCRTTMSLPDRRHIRAGTLHDRGHISRSMSSTSSSVFVSHKRQPQRAVRNRRARCPMASSTWLGSSEPDVHADCRTTRRCPSRPEAAAGSRPRCPQSRSCTLPGRRFTGSPLRAAVRNFRKSRDQTGRAAPSASAAFSANVRARLVQTPPPYAMMPGRFSVPARLPRSCAPPSIRLVRRNAALTAYSTTDALRTVELVRRERQHINVLCAATSIVQMSRRLHGVGVEHHACFACRPRRSGQWAGSSRSHCSRTSS